LNRKKLESAFCESRQAGRKRELGSLRRADLRLAAMSGQVGRGDERFYLGRTGAMASRNSLGLGMVMLPLPT
jgi:hypothetical protein